MKNTIPKHSRAQTAGPNFN